MNQLMLFLHFIGLIAGAGPGLANMVVARAAQGLPPEQAAPLRTLPRPLAMISAVGLAILWVSGLILMGLNGGPGEMPAAFWVKMIFVLILTGLVGYVHMILARLRRGPNPALAARMPKIGMANGLCALLAVLFAVIAFD